MGAKGVEGKGVEGRKNVMGVGPKVVEGDGGKA